MDIAAVKSPLRKSGFGVVINQTEDCDSFNCDIEIFSDPPVQTFASLFEDGTLTEFLDSFLPIQKNNLRTHVYTGTSLASFLLLLRIIKSESNWQLIASTAYHDATKNRVYKTFYYDIDKSVVTNDSFKQDSSTISAGVQNSEKRLGASNISNSASTINVTKPTRTPPPPPAAGNVEPVTSSQSLPSSQNRVSVSAPLVPVGEPKNMVFSSRESLLRKDGNKQSPVLSNSASNSSTESPQLLSNTQSVSQGSVNRNSNKNVINSASEEGSGSNSFSAGKAAFNREEEHPPAPKPAQGMVRRLSSWIKNKEDAAIQVASAVPDTVSSSISNNLTESDGDAPSQLDASITSSSQASDSVPESNRSSIGLRRTSFVGVRRNSAILSNISSVSNDSGEVASKSSSSLISEASPELKKSPGNKGTPDSEPKLDARSPVSDRLSYIENVSSRMSISIPQSISPVQSKYQPDDDSMARREAVPSPSFENTDGNNESSATDSISTGKSSISLQQETSAAENRLSSSDRSSLSKMGAGTPAQQKNAEFFRKMKEDENKRKLEEQSRLDGEELQKLKEAEALTQQHETEKTAHYSRLGGTFFNKSTPMLAGRGGGLAGGRGRGFVR